MMSATTANNREDNTPLNQSPPPPLSSRLRILSYLRAGVMPPKIAVKMNLSRGTVQYHVTALKDQGFIRKVGYGTWEILREPDTGSISPAQTTRVGPAQPCPSRASLAHLSQSEMSRMARFQQDSVRGHAFLFTLQVPKNLRNWNNERRERYLRKKGVSFKQLGIGGGGQRIIVQDRKVWLLNRSIIIYDTASYFAEASLQAKSLALAMHVKIIKHIERLLHVSFLIGEDYKFKISRQHYALIYNSLAKQYNDAGEKLEVRTGKGVWFLIDDSFSMDEAETVHPVTAMSDNRKVQGFFNGLKGIPAVQGSPQYTPGVVLEMIGATAQTMEGIQQNQLIFAANIATHITAIQELGAGVREMTKQVKALGRSK